LNPKSYKEIASKVADELSLSKELVTDAVNFFYSRVRINMSKLTTSTIQLPNLGTFKIRNEKLEKQIKKNEQILGNLDPTSFEKYGVHKSVKEKLEKLKGVKEIVEDQKKTKKEFYNNRDGKVD